MPESIRMWVEIIFNIAYLLTIWGFVLAMTKNRSLVSKPDQTIAQRIRWMFALLALGDTGHVGFRVIAYISGGLEANPTFVGWGALATAITVTFFYMILVDVWHLYFSKKMNWFAAILLATGIIRLVIMAMPGNEWGNVIPPQPMGIIRNIPLMIQGIGVMILIFIDAFKTNDATFKWIGAMIFTSYFFYTPVILFVDRAPLLGMLMIPKTLAYIAIAVIAYRAFYQTRQKAVAKR
jgi:hypothetical protein